jgi:hypothetical protein
MSIDENVKPENQEKDRSPEEGKNENPSNQGKEAPIEEDDHFVSVTTYARKCDVEVGTIYARLDKNDPKILLVSKIPGVEGVFINLKIYPPIKYKRGWKKGRKRKIDPDVPEPITDLNGFVKLTVELAHDHIKDITDGEERKNAFAKFLQERHKRVADQVSFEEFCKLIKNFK